MLIGTQQNTHDFHYSASRLLKNYRLAHERIEDQRLQMLEQEKQVCHQLEVRRSAQY